MASNSPKFKKRRLPENPQEQTVADDNKKVLLCNDSSTQFEFRRMTTVGYSGWLSDKGPPEFNLKSVSRALSEGWDPNTTWTEDELVLMPPVGGCEMCMPGDPWSHFNTAIHRALWFNQFDVAECLLAHGADINQLNASGRTVLHEAIGEVFTLNSFSRNWTKDIAWIVDHGADLNKKTEARSVIVTKLPSGADPFEYQKPGGLSPLRIAIEIGDLPKIQRLVEAGANVNLPLDDDGRWNALGLALISRKLEIAEALEHAGALLWTGDENNISVPLNAADDKTRTALQKKADDLLSFCLSGLKEGIPVSGCEDAFLLVVQTDEFQRVWQRRNSVERLSRYEECVDTFFQVLSSMAQRRNPQAVPDSYCALCKGLIARLSPFFSGRTHGPFQHGQTLRALESAASSNKCPFCNLLLDAIDANLSNKTKNEGPKTTQIIDSRDCPVEVSIQTEACIGGLNVACGKIVSRLGIDFLEEDLLHDLLDHRNDTEVGTGSPRALAAGKAWLKRCMENHPDCQRPQDTLAPVLPTRILDVACGTQSNPAVRLVEANGKEGFYCALSYCWGKSRCTTTTKANLDQHKRSISVEHLPATIQDAIVATRGLGFQYLWVDSLCIVQDDSDDWESEAAKMGEVYMSASLTISTLFGTDCSERLFTPRVFREPNPLPLSITAQWYTGKARWPLPAVQPPVERAGTGVTGEISLSFRGPIHLRGWTLQEQMLSARILWFGHGNVQWECLSQYAAEPSPEDMGFWRYKGFRKDEAHDAPLNFQETKQLILRPLSVAKTSISGDLRANKDEIDAYLEWENLVADYTTRKLTKESDRIPAIFGLAKIMEPKLQCEFVLGTWKGEYFLRSLLWRVKSPKTDTSRPPSGRLYPSWTWASKSDSAIDYQLVHNESGAPDSWPASLISMDVTLGGKSQSSATGSITLAGPLGRWSPEEHGDLTAKGPNLSFLDIGRHDDIHWDVFPAKPGPSSATIEATSHGTWYLNIVTFGRGPKPEGYGYPVWPNGKPGSTIRLFLEAADSQDPPQVFRRIGIGSYSCDSTDATSREVTII